MAIGFEDLNGTVRVPDKGMTLATTPKVRLANFGDGYTQRISYGINSLAQQFSVSFNDRTKAEIDAIVSFLNEKEGVESFDPVRDLQNLGYEIDLSDFSIVKDTDEMTKNYIVRKDNAAEKYFNKIKCNFLETYGKKSSKKF